MHDVRHPQKEHEDANISDAYFTRGFCHGKHVVASAWNLSTPYSMVSAGLCLTHRMLPGPVASNLMFTTSHAYYHS